MNKTIIFTLLIVLVATGSVFAAAVVNPKVINRITLPDTKVSTIASSLLDNRNVTVTKFVDGNVTCYVTGAGTAIACLK